MVYISWIHGRAPYNSSITRMSPQDYPESSRLNNVDQPTKEQWLQTLEDDADTVYSSRAYSDRGEYIRSPDKAHTAKRSAHDQLQETSRRNRGDERVFAPVLVRKGGYPVSRRGSGVDGMLR